MARQPTMRPQGEVRHSQLISTYGPGAMVDLPDCSVVIGGLNFWMYGPDQVPLVLTSTIQLVPLHVWRMCSGASFARRVQVMSRPWLIS
jgi:hypothetical protein